MAQEAGHPERVLAEVQRRLLGDRLSRNEAELPEQVTAILPAAARFWHALGFPIPQDWTDLPYTEADVAALRRITELIDQGVLTEELALSLTRATARSVDRLAVWQAHLVAESLLPPDAGDDVDVARADPPIAATLAAHFATLADDLEPLMNYAWRRHLLAALTRIMGDAAHEIPGTGTTRVIGFADLVNFTTVVRRLSERQLSAMVQRFEVLTTDVVTAHGGRVIKTVGDEVLYVATESQSGAAIALDLVDAMAEDPMLPKLRIGLAYGPVLSRMGDVFGTTVNRAARLTAVAPIGRVLCDEALAARLASISGFHLHPLRRRNLRGIGLVTPSDVTRARGARLPSVLTNA